MNFISKLNIDTVTYDNIIAIIGRTEMENIFKEKVLPIEEREDVCIISITDPNKEFADIEKKGFSDVLQIKFWDWDDKGDIGDYSLITLDKAEIIKNFIIKNKDKNFIINCEAGQSRSAAVGLFIEYVFRDKYLFPEFKHLPSKILSHARYDTNFAVFRQLVKTLTEEDRQL